MNTLLDPIQQASDYLKEKIGGKIDTAIILGSGLSGLTLPTFAHKLTVPYDDIPGIPKSTAPSHAGLIHILQSRSQTIALCAGRHHLYEGYSAQEISILIYVLKELGTQRLFITNAAGALNPDYRPGDIMLITDHINQTGENPLIAQDESLGPRFPDMSQAYHSGLRQKADAIAVSQHIPHHKGIYIGVKGPSLETSAERRMFRNMGADVVGMSTIVEVIAANHCSMDVLGLSAITNLALGDKNQQPDSIEEVIEYAAIAGEGIKSIMTELLLQG